jgi:hypothetical protein
VIKKRIYAPETCHLPIIPVILLMPSSLDEDVKQIIDNIGIDAHRISNQCNASELMKLILELLHRKTMIETVYTDLRIRLKNAKYPYINIFEEADDDFMNEESYENVPKTVKKEVINHVEESNSDDDDLLDADMDEWPDGSEVLPPFVTKLREVHGKTALKKKVDKAIPGSTLDPKARAIIDQHVLNVVQNTVAAAEEDNMINIARRAR